jgi:DNA-binding XRE family transcriptional regulator
MVFCRDMGVSVFHSMAASVWPGGQVIFPACVGATQLRQLTYDLADFPDFSGRCGADGCAYTALWRCAMLFGQLVKVLREEHKLTQQELADKAGMPTATVSQLEHSRRKPTWESVVRLARALGVPTDAFSDCDEVRLTPPGKHPGATRRKRRP